MSEPDASDFMPSASLGWAGMDVPDRHGDGSSNPGMQRDLGNSFARTFASADGERVLAHLKAITLDRALGPGASDAVLRHTDGQRCLYLHILALIERGRKGL